MKWLKTLLQTTKHFSLWKICARLLSNYIAEFILRVDVCYLVLFCIAQVQSAVGVRVNSFLKPCPALQALNIQLVHQKVLDLPTKALFEHH